VPIIGVVQGRALGFGCSIAALCDVTLAAESATFQVPEMQHNIMPTMVASALVDRVPRKAMTYLIWSTDVISAEQALTFGIVSKVAATASLELNLKKLTDQMLSAPRPAVRAVKEFARVALDMPISGAVDFARNLHATINSSSEMRRR
jgi:enoyl-CoA hydratase